MLKLVFRNERDGAGTSRNGRAGSPSSITARWSGKSGMRACSGPNAAQFGAEMELPVGMAEPVEEMPGLEPGPAIEPDAFLERVRPGQAAGAQCLLDDLESGHLEAGMAGAEALRQAADHLVVRAALGVGRQDGAADLQKGVAAGGVDVVVFEKRRRRQHDIGHRRGLGHELLVHADEQIVAGEPLVHERRIRARRPSGSCSGRTAP